MVGLGAEARDVVRRVVAGARPDLPQATIVPYGRGLDHAVFLVDDELVVRIDVDSDTRDRAWRVDAEVAVLDAVRPLGPPDVPRAVHVDQAAGAMAYERVGGVPLLTVHGVDGLPDGREIGASLGPFLARVHELDPSTLSVRAPGDAMTPNAWLEEARRDHSRVAALVPPSTRSRVGRFLDSPPPAPAARECLCHNDLGIEHVLVDPDSGGVVAVIDWADAAITDPAIDIALLWRDLGPGVVDGFRDGYPGVAALLDRAAFLARCSVFEELRYGVESGDEAFVAKSARALGWLFE